ncbi:MAG: nuclear transport factor 2 family protein [Bacteroidota bacterium]
MPTLKLIEDFVSSVETQPHDRVIADYYAEDASIQENQNLPRQGRDLLIKYERGMLDKAASVSSKCLRPYFVHGDEAVIRWKFVFTWKEGGQTTIEEIVHQVWEGDKIKREQFFYDPKQFVPVKQ